MPFLEVLTRVYKRPTMLQINMESLRRQTDQDFTQTFLVDDVGRGIEWSHENMAAYAPRLVGDWVWCLDDDDMCILPTFVEGLKAIAVLNAPDVIMVRMDHGYGRILPSARWGRSPQMSEIGASAYVVKRGLWQAHAGAMVPGKYTSDFELISSIWRDSPAVYWWDVIASRVQRQSLGAAE